MGSYRALIVASDFYGDDAFPPIPNAQAEAQALGKVLNAYGFEPFEVEYSLEDSFTSINQKVGRFFTSARPDDFILFYFGGHGRKGDDGMLYLVMRDTNLRGIVYTSLQTAMLNQLIRDCPARKKVIVLDACYSAAIEIGSRADQQQIAIERRIEQGKGTVILTSSNSVQQSYSREDRPSFTHYLTEGLKSGKADRDGDGLISLEEWFEYASMGVRSWQPGETIQTPQMFIKEKESDMYIGKTRADEEGDVSELRLPRTTPPPLKCLVDVIRVGDAPHLSLDLVNVGQGELTAVEIIGLTQIAPRMLRSIPKMTSGQRVNFTTPVYSDAGPILQVAIRCSDAYERPFPAVAIQIFEPPPPGRSRDLTAHGASTRKVEGQGGKETAAQLEEDEDESVLNQEKKKHFH